MLGYAIIFGLLLGLFYWIIHPLLKEDGRQNGLTPKPEDILEKLKQKKDGAYATIRELEFDLNMGKLTEEDFSILKQEYLQEAAGYMREIDKLESAQATMPMPTDTDLEQKIEEDAAAARAREPAARKFIYCTSCGRKAAVENRFCVACGSNLHEHAEEK